MGTSFEDVVDNDGAAVSVTVEVGSGKCVLLLAELPFFTNNSANTLRLAVYRGGTSVGENAESAVANDLVVGRLLTWDAPAAGEHTYTLRARQGVSAGTRSVLSGNPVALVAVVF